MARYQSPISASNPYVGIDVEYFDKKALEKQQRHDTAREAYSNFLQKVAEQPYLDEDARNQYLTEQSKIYEDVISKHSGNLSSGLHDIMKAVEKGKLSPYHNVNNRVLDQTKLRQAALTEYGADAIDLSTIPDKYYTRDEQGNIKWANPGEIKANVVKADDYAKILEDMLKNTTPQTWSKQTGLTGGSGSAYYLMTQLTRGVTLSPEQLMSIARDQYVQNAFLANATTAGIDNRNVPGTPLTYKEMLTNPDQLANWIYGNIQDMQRNDIEVSKSFVQNPVAMANLKAKKDQELEDYKAYLKRLEEGQVTLDAPIGSVKIDKETVETTTKKLQGQRNQEMNLTNQINNNVKDISEILGVAQFSTQAQVYDYSALQQANLLLPNGDFNAKQALVHLGKKYNIDINNLEGMSPDMQQKIKLDLELVENRVRDASETERNRRDLAEQERVNTEFVNTTTKIVQNKVFNELSADPEVKELMKLGGINNVNDLFSPGEIASDPFTKTIYSESLANQQKMIYRNSVLRQAKEEFNNQLNAGVETHQLYSALYNESDKAWTNRLQKSLGELTDQYGPAVAVGWYNTADGQNLSEYKIRTLTDSFWDNRINREYKNETVGEAIKDLVKKGYTVKLQTSVASPDANSNGVKQHLMFKVYDKDKKEVPTRNIFVPNVSMVDQFKYVQSNTALNVVTDALNSYYTDPTYGDQNVMRGFVMVAQDHAGDKIGDAFSALQNSNVKSTQRQILFSGYDNTTMAVNVFKDVDGKFYFRDEYGEVVKNDNGSTYKTNNATDAKVVASDLIGKAIYKSNPNYYIEAQRIPRTTYKNETSYSKYAFSKRDYQGITEEAEEE